MSEETITYNVVYNIEGIDNSIRSTQRLLYFTNAVRLSIVDIQQVMAGPTISNVMWTAVQLTRVWTNLYKIIRQTNQAQGAGMAQSALRGLTGSTVGATFTSSAAGAAASQWNFSGAFGAAAGGASNVAKGSLWGTITAFASANPMVIGGAVVALATIGVVTYDMREKRKYTEWRERQREVARSQGLEF